MKLTKKAENEARIAKNKYNAYWKKVSTLLGSWVFNTIKDRDTAIRAAYDAGTDAQEYATSIACLEPVGTCLWPMKQDAMNEAEKYAREEVELVRAELEKGAWDINAVAPYPERSPETPYGSPAYTRAQEKYAQYIQFVEQVDPYKYVHRREPKYVKMSDERIERYVKNERDTAGFTYDAFMLKMVAKVGPVIDASITGSHIWSHSILTVTKDGGTVERWKTQQIVNYSVYGRAYLQWPSRLMK